MRGLKILLALMVAATLVSAPAAAQTQANDELIQTEEVVESIDDWQNESISTIKLVDVITVWRDNASLMDAVKMYRDGEIQRESLAYMLENHYP